MTIKGSLNLARIAHRRLRRKPAPAPGPALAGARRANRIVLACNLGGLLAAGGLVAALFPATLVGDCPAALMAREAMRDIEDVAGSFMLGVLLAGAAPALLALLELARGAIVGEPSRDAEVRAIAAGWLARDPLLTIAAAALAVLLFADGAALLIRHVHARADWSGNAALRGQIAAICAELTQSPSAR